MNLILKTIIFGLTILAIDIPWIIFYMKKQYVNLFKKLNISFNGSILSAVLAYSIMILSFPVLIYNKNENIMLKRAFFLGLIIYGTYGFTLGALLPGYNLSFAFKETVWGSLLYTLATFITIKLNQLI